MGLQIPCLKLKRAARSGNKPHRAAPSCYALRTPSAYAGETIGADSGYLQALSYGPGGIRTRDLGIKSPPRLAATNCAELKPAANRAVHRCNELQPDATCRDKPVRPLYTHCVDPLDNV